MGRKYIRCLGWYSCELATIDCLNDKYVFLEGNGTACDGCDNFLNLMGASIVLPKNGTFEGYNIARNMMTFDGLKSTHLSVDLSASGSASLWELNGINYFRYEQTWYSEGIGMEVTFHSFAGDSPTIIFEEVVWVLRASAHIFLPVDGGEGVGTPPHVILKARSPNTLKNIEVSPPQSMSDDKSRISSLTVICPYFGTCDGLDITSIILDKNATVKLICDGPISCSNVLVGIEAADDSNISFLGVGDSLGESKISLDISHSQRVTISVTCKQGSCEGAIIDTSPIQMASNGSFVGDLPERNTLEVVCSGVSTLFKRSSCDGLKVSCPLRLDDLSPSSLCTLKVCSCLLLCGALSLPLA